MLKNHKANYLEGVYAERYVKITKAKITDGHVISAYVKKPKQERHMLKSLSFKGIM